MSLKQDLKNLKSRKRQELHTLHYTYLRTKRDVKRAASPERLIRKHIGASLGIAAIAGLLLAPRPSATKKEIEKAARKIARERESGPSITSRISQIVKSALGFVEQAIPSPKDVPQNGFSGRARPPKSTSLLTTLLGIVLFRVDVARIVSELTRQIMGRKQHAAAHANGKEPNVSVADAGTVKPDQMEDFQ